MCNNNQRRRAKLTSFFPLLRPKATKACPCRHPFKHYPSGAEWEGESSPYPGPAFPLGCCCWVSDASTQKIMILAVRNCKQQTSPCFITHLSCSLIGRYVVGTSSKVVARSTLEVGRSTYHTYIFTTLYSNFAVGFDVFGFGLVVERRPAAAGVEFFLG